MLYTFPDLVYPSVDSIIDPLLYILYRYNILPENCFYNCYLRIYIDRVLYLLLYILGYIVRVFRVFPIVLKLVVDSVLEIILVIGIISRDFDGPSSFINSSDLILRY